MKLEFIPGEIISRSRPIFDAAIIRLNRDDIKNPPDIAFLKPNNLVHNNEGIIFTRKRVITNNPINKNTPL